MALFVIYLNFGEISEGGLKKDLNFYRFDEVKDVLDFLISVFLEPVSC